MQLLFVFILAIKCTCCAPRWLKLRWRGTAPPPLPILMREWRWDVPGFSGITCCCRGADEEGQEGLEEEEEDKEL